MSSSHDRILIGVHVTTGSQGLPATLAAIHETTALGFELIVLVDPSPGEAESLAQVLALCRGVAQLRVPGPGGAAASFNQLITQPADLYVFLENDVRPGPDWLEHLVRALDADPRNGLAGPSTNRCWNEQGVAPTCGDSTLDVERQAESLLQRFGPTWRSLAPLYSLADFCFVVRQQVVAAVGAADTGYARGPCWEMDYSIRAARAGFCGVWARAAFVRRGPLPAWRIEAEPALLQVNKRVYQDRFCGRRKGPIAAQLPQLPYHEQCRGDDCPDFAPATTTRVQLPLPSAEPLDLALEQPLVSCIMPTRGRPEFVARAILYFRRQLYPNRELIIVHEDAADLPDVIHEPNIRVVQTKQRSIGGKRNEGTRIARGTIIAHWDDDDWHSEQRLTRQVAPIVRGIADITGLSGLLFLVIGAGEFWAVTRGLFRRLFLENVSGGTLVFRRELWDQSGPYPATSLREDAEFMAKAIREGARLCRLPGRDLYVYVRHDRNTWKFSEGRYLQQSEWSQVPEPEFLGRDREFYAAAASVAPSSSSAQPLVSCIMPTANRRAFVPRAIEHFLAQDYPARELIIIDDGEDNIADLIPQSQAVRYLRLERRTSLGEKRNLACEMARGELVAHWDDDDWMAPQWLGSQIQTLLEHRADICGLDRVYFYAPDTRQAWRYVYDGAQPWVCGGTLCYTRDFWRRVRFPQTNVGEDNALVWSAQPKRLVVNGRNDLYVATVHQHNTSPKATSSARWHSFPASHVEQLMLQV
ncbi:putative glycosyltransferase EpsH [Enhygromyxa salina]|uniref:Putative glycosyltransferase EpsH n=1 Tax=Enhygromyxa salina TaxID=215803 RepID=A0A2S9XDK6_9BACT|nr:glycosyltransferase [Enhygromyxa salina]PRP90771.1 putative glycosyltransferase EpsH [Enhygromyxa salina]